MIRLTREPIEAGQVIQAVQRPACGAVAVFLGTVRDHSQGKAVAWLEYEAYEPMAERRLSDLLAEARSRWALGEMAIVHRLGRLAVGETSVAIAVSAAHRAEALAACGFLIDRLKQIVPIWKKEVWQDGTSAWA